MTHLKTKISWKSMYEELDVLSDALASLPFQFGGSSRMILRIRNKNWNNLHVYFPIFAYQKDWTPGKESTVAHKMLTVNFYGKV
jgi:hypothetical protein